MTKLRKKINKLKEIRTYLLFLRSYKSKPTFLTAKEMQQILKNYEDMPTAIFSANKKDYIVKPRTIFGSNKKIKKRGRR